MTRNKTEVQPQASNHDPFEATLKLMIQLVCVSLAIVCTSYGLFVLYVGVDLLRDSSTSVQWFENGFILVAGVAITTIGGGALLSLVSARFRKWLHKEWAWLRSK